MEEETPYWSPGDEIPGTEKVTQVELTGRSWSLANQYIHSSRPQGFDLIFQELNSVLPSETEQPDEESGTLIGAPPGDDSAADVCPLAMDLLDISIKCRELTGVASGHAIEAAQPLFTSITEQIINTHTSELRPDELTFVSNWATAAVTSGVSTGSIQAVGLIRELQLCDTNPTPPHRAFMVGERQARELVREAEEEVLSSTPRTQCSTDVIAASILAASQDKISQKSFCEGFTADDIFHEEALQNLHNNWARGMRQGFSDSYELLRVQLVETWSCESAPPPEEETSADESEQDCICYTTFSSSTSVSCFSRNISPPNTAWELYDLSESTPQCVPACRGESCSPAQPVGDPLVIDLDGDGIKFTYNTIAFDLADTGELVRIQALKGADALIALDLNNDGAITTGAELFSNNSACEARRCFDGIEALTVHDLNRDGVIDVQDPVFTQLLIWRDHNLNGLSELTELSPLATQLRSIGLKARHDLAWTDAQGNSAMRAINATHLTGRELTIHDVWFSLSFNSMPANPRTTGAVSSL